MGVLKLYWVSFWSRETDFEPVFDPPTGPVVGWWSSGERGDANSVCVLVASEDETGARSALAENWPEFPASEERFFEARIRVQVPDRFPISRWMNDRIRQLPAHLRPKNDDERRRNSPSDAVPLP